jgi:hypothetical protein
MEQPDRERILISDQKLIDYLLNPRHPDGQSKAWFLSRFGYSIANYPDLKAALLQIGQTGEVINVEGRPPFGTRFTIRGVLQTPDRRNPLVITGWFIETDDAAKMLKFVTMVPDKSSKTNA